MFTSFVGLGAGDWSRDAYAMKTEPEKYQSDELMIFERVFNILYPTQRWRTADMDPEQVSPFVAARPTVSGGSTLR